METITKRTTWLGIATLILVLAVGVGIGIWFVKSSRADNAPAAQQTSTSPATRQRSSSSTSDWDPVREMDRMQEEIDRAIRNVTEQFDIGAGGIAFPRDAGYSSSFDLRDRNDHYELRAYLPDVKAPDVNVRIDNDRTLHVSVTQRKGEKKQTANGSANFTELGQYEQVVTLPEPVRSSDMKIDRHGHEVVITIPKASSTTINSI